MSKVKQQKDSRKTVKTVELRYPKMRCATPISSEFPLVKRNAIELDNPFVRNGKASKIGMSASQSNLAGFTLR